MEIIVDLFNQHSGDIEELKRMAYQAYVSGADVVKLQLLNSKKIWGDESRKHLELDFETVETFYNYCKNMGIEFLATVFDEERFEWIKNLGVKRYKIASITAYEDKELCQKILLENRETIISLGKYPLNVFPFGHDPNIKYLYCICNYPTYLDDEKIKKMPTQFSQNHYIGFSDHVVGYSALITAYFRGAKIVEKHFTFNINLNCSTEKAHQCSFTPESLRQFKNIIRELDIIHTKPN